MRPRGAPIRTHVGMVAGNRSEVAAAAPHSVKLS